MTKLSRRDFLKVCAAGAGSYAALPVTGSLLPEDRTAAIGKGRVTVFSIGVYEQPDLESDRVREVYRDEIINLYESLISPAGPPLNPRWYRVAGGYAHSAYLQRVEAAQLNTPDWHIPSAGRLGEVSVPYTQSLRKTAQGWEPAYRLYFQSVHWVMGAIEGPDEKPWYRLVDELLRIDYAVPATHVRLIDPRELTPLSLDVPAQLKRIEVSLLEQRLIAYEDRRVVLDTRISSGMPNLGPVTGIPTDTPKGNFKIDPKVPSKHMGDGQLTSDVNAYELPGVPWVCFFQHETGVAFHGTYWHDNFGARMSHGCVNMRVEDAKWLYRWSSPYAASFDRVRKGRGTRVVVS